MNKAKIDTLFNLTVEIVSGNQVIQRNGYMLLEVSGFVTKYDAPPLQVQTLRNSLKFVISDAQVTLGVGNALMV